MGNPVGNSRALGGLPKALAEASRRRVMAPAGGVARGLADGWPSTALRRAP